MTDPIKEAAECGDDYAFKASRKILRHLEEEHAIVKMNGLSVYDWECVAAIIRGEVSLAAPKLPWKGPFEVRSYASHRGGACTVEVGDVIIGPRFQLTYDQCVALAATLNFVKKLRPKDKEDSQ